MIIVILKMCSYCMLYFFAFGQDIVINPAIKFFIFFCNFILIFSRNLYRIHSLLYLHLLQITGLRMSGGRRRELARGRRPSAPTAGWPARSAGQTEDDSSAAPMARRFSVRAIDEVGCATIPISSPLPDIP